MIELLVSSSYFIVNKKLAKKVGLKASVLLADMIGKKIYFENNKMLNNGYFFNTSENIKKDTGLSNYQQKKAIQKLIDIDFLECKLQGVPATLHFRLNEIKIAKMFESSFQETSKQDFKKVKSNNTKQLTINNIKQRERKFIEEINQLNTTATSEQKESFASYWTEPNRSKTKMRFEIQKTFDVNRRLLTWIRNDKKFNNKTSKLDSQIDSYIKAKNLLK